MATPDFHRAQTMPKPSTPSRTSQVPLWWPASPASRAGSPEPSSALGQCPTGARRDGRCRRSSSSCRSCSPTSWACSGQGGPTAGTLRTGADAWMRTSSARLGLTDQWFLPLLLVVILLGWQVAARDWRFSPSILVGDGARESRPGDRPGGHQPADRPRILAPRPAAARRSSSAMHVAPGRLLAPLIGFLGAGVYEEALFRLVLVPLFFGSLRLLQTPQVLASCPGGDGLGLALLAGPSRGHARRGVHLVRLRLPLDGRRLLRLGLRRSADSASRSARIRRTISWSAGSAGISDADAGR